MTSETDAEFVERIENRWMIAAPGDDIDRLFALARRGAAMQWRPIEEAPTGDLVVARYVMGTLRLARKAASGNWFGPDNGGITTPKWYMPLPPPPAGETNE